MMPKYRFFDPYEFPGLYNVIELRLDVDTVVIEDDKNTSILEQIENDYYVSQNGHPTYSYGIDEGILDEITCFVDVNKKPIWQNDIVSVFLENDYIIGVVSFSEMLGMWVVNFKDGENMHLHVMVDFCEVIGNIHENPELI